MSDKEVMVKVVWNRLEDKWGSVLLTSLHGEHKRRPLGQGEDIDIEVIDERRCIGYIGEEGRIPCPSFSKIDTGQQCYQCRNKDIHVDYVEGRSGERRQGNHSVYLVQIGDNIKVGVTRTSRLMRRWVEQGAVYAAEIKVCETADDALDMESDISDSGIKERIGKKNKSTAEKGSPDKLKSVMDKLGTDSEVVDVQSNTIYDDIYPNKKASRTNSEFDNRLLKQNSDTE